MSVQAFAFFTFGILAELLLLAINWLANFSRSNIRRRVYILIAGLAAAAAFLAFLVEQLGTANVRVYLDTPLVSFIFILLGVFVFFAALAANLFVPVINEQTILVVQLLVLYYIFNGGSSVPFMPLALLAGVPAVVSLGLIFWRQRLPAVLKAPLYLWYLLTLMIIPFQSNQVAYFRRSDLTLLEGAAFGALLVFLIIHGLFAVRFFLITSSLILPRNRPQVAAIMPALFSDEQVPIGRLVVAVALMAALILLNRALQLLPEDILLSLGMLFAVQFLSQRKMTKTV